jgi:hypothetical protein
MAEGSRSGSPLKGPWGHADVLIQTMKRPQRGGELRLQYTTYRAREKGNVS